MSIYKAHRDLIIQHGEYVGKVYRCSGCGKWSHAKKKPTKHIRCGPFETLHIVSEKEY